MNENKIEYLLRAIELLLEAQKLGVKLNKEISLTFAEVIEQIGYSEKAVKFMINK